MTFSPINDDHALETVRFSLGLSELIGPQTVQDMKNNHVIWADALPALADEVMTLDNAKNSINLPGVSFAFLRPDGNPTWSLHAVGFELFLVCNLYTRWGKVWSRSSEYLAFALAMIGKNQPSIKVLKAELTVHDAFWDTDEDYALNDLLVNTKHIAPFIFDVGTAWHTKNGWFSEENGKRLLHNLDLDSTAIGTEVSKVQIKHFMRRELDVLANSQDKSKEVMNVISEAFAEMHDQNKLMLTQVLSPKIIKRIKLKEQT